MLARLTDRCVIDPILTRSRRYEFDGPAPIGAIHVTDGVGEHEVCVDDVALCRIDVTSLYCFVEHFDELFVGERSKSVH